MDPVALEAVVAATALVTAAPELVTARELVMAEPVTVRAARARAFGVPSEAQPPRPALLTR